MTGAHGRRRARRKESPRCRRLRGQKLVEAQEHYTLTTGRVLTLIVAATEGDDREASLSSVRDASHEHPSRVLVVMAGSHEEETHLDADA